MSSIRTRIANRFALLILTAVAIFAGTVYAARRAGALSDMERLARQRATIVLQILASAGSGSFSIDERAPEDPVSGTVQGLGAVGMLKNFLDAQPGYLLVWSPDEREVYRSASVRALSAYLQGDQVTELARADNQAFAQWVSEARTRLEAVPYALRADNGILLGVRSERGFVAVVGVSSDELPTSWREILGSALVSLPFVVLLAVLGAYMLAGNVLAPVDRMRQEVEAITDGRSLHKRLNVEGDDEMARLTSSRPR
jgi:two-component system, OmpR family, sensor kinase